MNIIVGDLLKLASEGQFDVIVHGCNCHTTMAAGVAKGIKLAFPEAYEADLTTSKSDRTKLGTISCAEIHRFPSPLTVVNAYTQFHWKGTGIKADYKAIRSCFKEIKQRFTGKRIGYPLIGAGLAGGDWNVIAEIIDEELVGENHTLVQLKV